MNKYFNRKFGLAFAFCLIFVSSFTNVFAWGERGPHEEMRGGHESYHYRDGRFYRPGWFGLFEFSVVVPPVGAVVTELPVGHRVIVVGDRRYYYYDDVYYVAAPEGYIVVQEPVVSTKVVAVKSVVTSTSSKASGETAVVNVPNSNGSFTPVKMIKYNDGYIGPQGEYYPGHPTVAQLKVLYGN